MQLHVAELTGVVVIDDANAEGFHAGSPRRVVVALRDDHVAAVAAAALEIAPAGGLLAGGRHHLEQLVADREQRVFEAEAADPGVAEAHLDAEHVDQLLFHGCELLGHQRDLAQAEPRGS